MVITLLMLTGCVGRSAPTVNYFNLLTIEQLGDSGVIGMHPKINLGVGPITIPDSLKRSQIATSQHGIKYEFDEYNRWAGVLDKNLASVVGENLSTLLGVKNVGYFPWMAHFTPTYQIVITIQRLDGALNGEAVLIARWSVLNATGKELLAGGRNEFQQHVEHPSFTDLVKAESLLVAELSKTMARGIDRLIGQQAP